MSSKDEEAELGDGEGSSGEDGDSPVPAIASLPLCLCTDPVDQATMKRAAAKLIERYFYQLTNGCGNTDCDNEHCASSGKVSPITPNQAAALAIHLFRDEARLCESQPRKVARTEAKNSANRETTPVPPPDTGKAAGKPPTPEETQPESSSVKLFCKQDIPSPTGISFLTERRLSEVIAQCEVESSYSHLIRTIGDVYSRPESLGRSFLKSDSSPLDAIPPCYLANMKKEEMRELEGELEKDQDCAAGELEFNLESLTVDVVSLRRCYDRLFALPAHANYENALVHALITLADNVELDFRLMAVRQDTSSAVHKHRTALVVNALLIVLEMPMLGAADYLELALPRLCRAAAHLPVNAQARLSRLLAQHSRPRLKQILHALHQLITVRVISGHFATRDYCVQDDDAITTPTKLMAIIYYATMMAGELDAAELRQEEARGEEEDLLNVIAGNKAPRQPILEDPLGAELKLSVLDSRNPYFAFTEFYNEPLSDIIEMDKDFANYKGGGGGGDGGGGGGGESNKKFSFMRYAFVLTPATKTLGLYYDNRIRMYSERRMSFLQTVVGLPTNPYLRLKVRRDHIIEDALVELEMVSLESPKDLKKQLVVEFEGEQGIDEGGVSKEFFQLIVDEIFNPDYGMFTLQQETETMWFNTTSFEIEGQFKLIGIVLGLAIYNNIILDVHFPMVVYRKLMGKRGTYHDLRDWNQTLYNGLQSMLDHEENDIEEVFVQTFRICYTDVFGSVLFHDLKPGGDKIPVTQVNKKEFVDLYADFLLNTSVEKQFRAFRWGFQMVTDESPLHLLFRPEEVEQLVCGSKKFELRELEEATEYDGGYTSESSVVKWFWEIAHTMPVESQRKLLQFATGSDRVPVGGLSKLKLIIARNGPDSDRLPTAHTCFNVLLLPEYSSKDKLQEQLMKAINYSKGFGML